MLTWLIYSVLDLALKPWKRVVVKLDLTLTHPSYFDNFVVLWKCELLIDLWPIQKLKRKFLHNLLIFDLWGKLYNHVWVSKWNDESMLEHKVFIIIDPYESSWTISKVSKVVLFIKFLVLNDHVPFAYSSESRSIVLSVRVINSLHFTVGDSQSFLVMKKWLLFVSNYKVVVVFSCLRMLLLWAYYCASIFLLPLTGYEALSINDEQGSNHLLYPFHDLDLKYRCNLFFFLRYENAFDWLIEIHWANKFLKLHALSDAASISFTPMTNNNLCPILAFSPMILLLVLLKLVLILNVFTLMHTYTIPVLKLRGLPTVQAIVKLALVTWNLLVTITAAHYK